MVTPLKKHQPNNPRRNLLHPLPATILIQRIHNPVLPVALKVPTHKERTPNLTPHANPEADNAEYTSIEDTPLHQLHKIPTAHPPPLDSPEVGTGRNITNADVILHLPHQTLIPPHLVIHNTTRGNIGEQGDSPERLTTRANTEDHLNHSNMVSTIQIGHQLMIFQMINTNPSFLLVLL